MRREFHPLCARLTVKRRCPWAAVIAKGDAGWWAFESVSDYWTWRGQK